MMIPSKSVLGYEEIHGDHDPRQNLLQVMRESGVSSIWRDRKAQNRSLGD